MFEKEAKERAEEIEAKQTLGVYDNDEDLARDEGWNDGYVSGYEDGFKDGAEYGYNKKCEEMFEMALSQIKHNREVVIGYNERLQKENAGLKARLNAINLLTPELEKSSKLKSQRLTYAKTIIKDLLDNSDEYARQRAEDFLKENK